MTTLASTVPTARVHTAALRGLTAFPVTLNITLDSTSLTIHGLPPAAAHDVSVRVRAALAAVGVPRGATVVVQPSLTSNDITSLDVPIALGVLAAAVGGNVSWLDSTLVTGELGLGGSVRHGRGALPIAEMAQRAGFKTVLVPTSNASKAALAGLTLFHIGHLRSVAAHLVEGRPLPVWPTGPSRGGP